MNFYLLFLQNSYIRFLDHRMGLLKMALPDLGLKPANCLKHVGFLSSVPPFCASLSIFLFFIFIESVCFFTTLVQRFDARRKSRWSFVAGSCLRREFSLSKSLEKLVADQRTHPLVCSFRFPFHCLTVDSAKTPSTTASAVFHSLVLQRRYGVFPAWYTRLFSY